ncbi:alpha-E domain-containing protein [Dongia sp.]|uniref:alpha-E domain-containing protein n=1 Tax=Dongia sp. TaxID=1977262 RepID=UPI0035B1C09F
MLSRTADSLFWLSRYVERADYLARVLEAATRLSALPKAYGSGTNEWQSALATAGCSDLFHRFHDEPTAATVIDFLAFSEDNPASIRRCLEIARTNARAVRTALTAEMWNAINGAWLELQQMPNKASDPDGLMPFLDWVKEVSLRFDGSGYRTMLRNDAYWFARLGIFIERADNTARILDVKYHVLLPEHAAVGGGIDYAQWSAILRAVSALTSYHWVYRQGLQPWLIADLLILNEQMPRSLAACYDAIVGNLERLGGAYGRHGESQRLARSIHVQLENSRIEQIFQGGLHEFISTFIVNNNRLGGAIATQYLS